MPHWGVHSINPAHLPPRQYPDNPVVDISDRPTLYDYVKRRNHGRAPVFWGRYINNHSDVRLTRAEVNWLHHSERNCKVVLIYNGIRNTPRLRNHTIAEAEGVRDATRAIDAANALTPPGHVRLYADLEGWQVCEEWIRGWCRTIGGSRYAGCGGIYGNVPNASQANHVRQNPRTRGRHYWSLSFIPQADQQGQNPSRAIAGSNTSYTTMPTCTSVHMWSSQPRAWPNQLFPACDSVPSNFTPNRLPDTTRFPTVLWHYGLNCWRVTVHRRGASNRRFGLVDMDLATDEALRGMW